MVKFRPAFLCGVFKFPEAMLWGIVCFCHQRRVFMNLLAKRYLIDRVTPYVFWITLALFLTLLCVICVGFFAKKRALKTSFICVTVFTIYALVVGIFLLSLDVYKHFNQEYLGENYVDKSVVYLVLIPVIITLSLALISAVTLIILGKKKLLNKKVYALFGGVCLFAVLCTLITVGVYFAKNISNDGYYSEKLDGASLYITTVLLIVLIIAFSIIFDKKGNFIFTTKQIATAGVCIALSFVLSYIKLFKMPQGGSITLCSLFPVMLFSYIYGAKKGIAVGFIYGLLQALQDPFIIHPAQFLLDYPVAFSCVGLTGILNGKAFLEKMPSLRFAILAVITAIFRFVSHLLSGVFAFGAYAEGNVLLYSLAYNSFVFVDMLFVIVVGAIVLANKSFLSVLKREKN